MILGSSPGYFYLAGLQTFALPFVRATNAKLATSMGGAIRCGWRAADEVLGRRRARHRAVASAPAAART